MRNHVVVGIDGSEASGRALEVAAVAARSRETGLLVLYALQMPVAGSYFGVGLGERHITEREKYAAELLAAAETRLHEIAAGVEVETRCDHGTPTAVLLKAAQSAALLVLGNRGLGSLEAVFLGSVSTRVASKARCPVIVVSDALAAADRDTAGEDSPPVTSRPVVVGMDGSPYSDEALRYALDAARRLGAPVKLVAAWHLPVMMEPLEPQVVDQLIGETESELAESVLRALDRIGAECRQGLEIATEISMGRPVDVLLAASEEAALTVVGSHGRGAIRGVLLGSVSRTLLREASSPVTVVHATPQLPPERES